MCNTHAYIWEFPKTGGTLFWGPYRYNIRILLFRVVYSGPLFSETPIYEKARVCMLGLQGLGVSGLSGDLGILVPAGHSTAMRLRICVSGL